MIPCEIKESETDSEKMEYVTEDTGTLSDETKRPVILIAEDSASNYMVISRILKKHFTIVWSLNGQDALNVVKAKDRSGADGYKNAGDGWYYRIEKNKKNS